MDVTVIAGVGNFGVQFARSASRDGRRENDRRIGRGVAAVTVTANDPSSADSVPITSAAGAPERARAKSAGTPCAAAAL